MKRSIGLVLLAGGTAAHAGGLFLPGSGAISTSRAGAAVASTDDGEALSINPAGLAKTHDGWTITVSASMIRYYMEFTRRGTYDAVDETPPDPYTGQRYPTVTNDPKPPLGIGSYQPIPVVAAVANLDKLGYVPHLTVALGLYAPSGYPFRNMTNGYDFVKDTQTNTKAPPPTRYDVMKAESQLLFPSIGVAYSVIPQLDLGLRASFGRAKSKQSVVVQGTPGNVNDSVRHDTFFEANVSDGFVPTFGIGATYRPTPKLEFGAVYNYSATLRLKGTAKSVKGPNVDTDRVIGPIPDDMSRCQKGGSFEEQKACIALQLPMSAYAGGRYKFLDESGVMRGDIELNVGWEHWGKTCDFTSSGQLKDPDCVSPSQILVKLDTGLYNTSGEFAQPVEVNFVNLGLRDTYTARLGGSWVIPFLPTGENIILRGGLGYDTAAAKKGWLRTSFDGAARITTTLGAAFHTPKWEVNLGAGLIYEGSNTNPGAGPGGRDCNPTTSGDINDCGNGVQRPLDQRQGPDPTSPLLVPELQFENPFNQGTIKSHYLLFMLGYSTWF
jgi:long-subunit fatty acid transport protein